jgi:hypothetical protein
MINKSEISGGIYSDIRLKDIENNFLFLHLEGYPIFSLVIALKIINDSLL